MVRRPRILVIDDDPRAVRLVSLTLKQAGYEVFSAQDGSEGLSRALQLQPDLIILDVMMPDINGYEVCRRLQSDPTTADTAILMFSARDGSKAQSIGFESGAMDYLTKPVEPRELIRRVRSVLWSRGIG